MYSLEIHSQVVIHFSLFLRYNTYSIKTQNIFLNFVRYYAIKIIEWLASFACFASIACFIISFSGSFFLNSDKWHNTLMVMCNRITWGRLLLSLASCTPSFFPFWWFSWLFASFPSLAMQFLIQEKQLPFYTKFSFKTACLKILLKNQSTPFQK